MPLARPTAAAAPRRSTRLAKKALHRTPTVAAAQNLLMKKLRLVTDTEIATEDFEAYIRIFKEWLAQEQCKLIVELFMQQEAAMELPKDD
jgi:hypothetical protein